MNQFKKLMLMLVLLLIVVTGMAQKKVITGKVVDQSSGEPLAGASITFDKSTLGQTSKPDGTFAISVPDSAKKIIVSFIGFASQSISIGNKTVFNVSMIGSAGSENEVVVIGYGSQRKSSLTGAVSKFKNENLDEAPVSRLDQALQGKIAGVSIQNVSPEAGAPAKVRVRGTSSINAGANPLVVVDGHPVADGLSFVNSADVESIEVLKDAASAAIYGSRGASGVILITTKSGKTTKPKYNFKSSLGTKSAYKTYGIMTSSEWLKLLFAEAELKKLDPSVPAAQLTVTGIAPNEDRAGYVLENELTGGPTDWQKVALRDATLKNLQLSVSGGSKEVKYFISGAYQNDQGMMIHSEYERFSLRSKIEAQLSNKVKLTFNLNPSYAKRESPSERFQDFVRWRSWMPTTLNDATAAFINLLPANSVTAGSYAQARYFSGRTYSGTMPDGSLWSSGATIVNPFNTSNQTPYSSMENQSQFTNEYRVLTSVDLAVNILPGLDFKSLASAYMFYAKGNNFAKRDATRAGDVNRGVYNDNFNMDLLNENTLTYSKRIKDHSFNVLAGFTIQKTKNQAQQVVGLDYPSDNIQTLNNALTIDRASSTNTINQIGLVSYLGRLTYSYKDKYLFATSFRADGSSYFANGNKWGSFPSISLGWNASKEKFMDNVNWINNLKLRSSYGVSGNNRIADYAFLDLLFSANYVNGAGNGSTTVGQIPSTSISANQNITWERTNQYNFGVDLSILSNALSFSLDVYQSKTEKLLLRQSAQAFTGVAQTWNNIGSLRNNGFEFEVTSNNYKRKNFTWTTSANIAQTRNSIIELGKEALILNQGERTELYLNRVGDPLVQFYGYKTDGVWLSQSDIDKAIAGGLKTALTPYFVPGGLKLKDLNGDNVIDGNDRTVIGSPYPDFTWGITNTFRYKALDFSFLLQGVQGGSIINGDANYLEIKRTTRAYSDNRWVSALNPGDGKTPIANVGFQNWLLTDYTVEDASYWALREVIVGYTLPESWIKRAKLSSMRFYFTASNLFFKTAASFRALNPEARISSGPYNTPLIDGYQRGAFPINRSFLFGIDINF